MFERLSRFDTRPGDIKVPASIFYPSKPVQLQARWRVRLIVDTEAWVTYFGEAWTLDVHVWATLSTEAVEKARAEFFGNWASAGDRIAFKPRVVEVLQEAV